MKIGNPIVVLCNIFPNLHGMLMITVKGTIDKLDLLHIMIQKMFQFLLHQGKASKTHPLING